MHHPHTSDPQFTERQPIYVLRGSCWGGSNGRHRWQRQNETQVEELNSYNKGSRPKHLIFKEDLGPQRLFVLEPKLSHSVKQEMLLSR